MELPLRPFELAGKAIEAAQFAGRLVATASFYIASEVAHSRHQPNNDIITPARISIYSTDYVVKVKEESNNGSSNIASS